MTDDERRGSELIAMRSGPVEVVRAHNRAHVTISRPLNEYQTARIFEIVSAIVRSGGARIEALERLEKAADPLRIVIENSKGVWCCDFAEDDSGEWDGENCPWSDFECVTQFLQALSDARERRGE